MKWRGYPISMVFACARICMAITVNFFYHILIRVVALLIFHNIILFYFEMG